MTTPKEDNCAGIPGDYIAFSLKDASSPTGFADFKLPITRTFYEYEEPESRQKKYIDHTNVSLFGKNTEYSGVLNPPVPTASPPRYQATTPASSPPPSGRFANHKSSRRLPTILEESRTPPSSGRFAKHKSSFSLFGGPYVNNPLSSVPNKGGKTHRKRSKRRKTHRR